MMNKDRDTIISSLKDFLSEFTDAYNHKNSFTNAKIRDNEIGKDQRIIDRANAYINQNKVLHLAFNNEVDNNPMLVKEIRDELLNPEHFRSTLNEVIEKLKAN